MEPGAGCRPRGDRPQTQGLEHAGLERSHDWTSARTARSSPGCASISERVGLGSIEVGLELPQERRPGPAAIRLQIRPIAVGAQLPEEVDQRPVLACAIAEHEPSHEPPPLVREPRPGERPGRPREGEDRVRRLADRRQQLTGRMMDRPWGVEMRFVEPPPLRAHGTPRDQNAVRLEPRERGPLLGVGGRERLRGAVEYRTCVLGGDDDRVRPAGEAPSVPRLGGREAPLAVSSPGDRGRVARASRSLAAGGRSAPEPRAERGPRRSSRARDELIAGGSSRQLRAARGRF
jgi:hypothetical protein